MTPAQRIFKRALSEKLAFILMGANGGAQAAGPGGAPVQPGPPGAGGPPGAPPGPGGPPGMPPGAPMDPNAPPGPAPMDPSAAPPGAPMDPSAGGPPGAPPMDPSAGGPPPMDPNAGAPPVDPAAAGMPPMDAPPPADDKGLTPTGVDIVDKITQHTMDIVRQTLEMVGKAKTKEERSAALASIGKDDTSAPPLPGSAPGPVSGMPGFDPSMISGPLKTNKTASILGKILASKH